MFKNTNLSHIELSSRKERKNLPDINTGRKRKKKKGNLGKYFSLKEEKVVIIFITMKEVESYQRSSNGKTPLFSSVGCLWVFQKRIFTRENIIWIV